jgi:nucleotide-binding universal stress UspA family protein
MNTIIALTDFSDAADAALVYAARFAKKFKAQLLIYHSAALGAPVAELPLQYETIETLTKSSAVKLKEEKQKIEETYGLAVETIMDNIPVQDRLHELASQHHANLIVMGLSGSNASERKSMGSTAVSVISNSHFPVLVVPEGSAYRAPKHILFAYDFISILPAVKFSLLRELALVFDAEINVLHISNYSGRNPRNTNIETLLMNIRHNYHFVGSENIAKAIEQSVQTTQPDLLVMAPREHGYWDILKNKSITNKVAFHTTVPLLSLPNPLHRQR